MGDEFDEEVRIPVTELWDGVLLLSLSGIIDSARAQEVMDRSLGRIAVSRSRIFILDILGVAAVDTAVANHLIKITQATRLLGCDCVISGISPAVAQSLVHLGVPLHGVITRNFVRDALDYAFGILELEVVSRRRGGA